MMFKSIILAAFLFLFIVSCNDEKESSAGEAPNITNIENVNGALPDTSNSSTLNQVQPIDSSKTDSLRK